ncbi:MAG: serine/threonine protein kinase [Planctomycetes bacterium]|nr:serine/threonine protein kinase [Planctomycetota bacterium]
MSTVGLELRIPGYALEGLAGSGTYSKVYRARRESDGRRVAIKALDQDLVDYSQDLKYASDLQDIASPYIASLLEHGRTPDGTWFLVLEWAGVELYDWIETRGALGVADAYLAAYQATEGVRALQRARFFHLDISPGNLFADETGNISVCDFGMCVRIVGRARKLDGRPRGTPGFTAPEVMKGRAHIASDVFSLGASLHWMLTGKPPLGDDDGKKPRGIVPGLPEPAEWILQKALDPKPEGRFQTLAELSHHLKLALDGTWTRPSSRPTDRGSKRAPKSLWRRWIS